MWNCIECTHIGNPTVKPTPQQVKAEVWMSIIHGSQGIIYLGRYGIAVAARKHHKATYLFAVRMEASPAKGAFQVTGTPGKATVRVLGENRTTVMHEGRFEDEFAPHAVHLYQVLE